MDAMTAASTPTVPATPITPTNALLVGADRLGNIPDVLRQFGIRIAAHVSGRDRVHQRRSSTTVPAGVKIVILFTDFLGHNVMQGFRDAANRAGVSFICCRRSVCDLQQVLDRRAAQEKCANCTALLDQTPPRGGQQSQRIATGAGGPTKGSKRLGTSNGSSSSMRRAVA